MTVYRAGLPVLAPPDVIPTPEAHDDLPQVGSDSSSRKIDDVHPRVDSDNSKLRTDEPGKGLSKFDRPLRVDSDEPIEVDFADMSAFEGECDHPFSFFYLSSEDCRVHRVTMSMLIRKWNLPSQENRPQLTSMSPVRRLHEQLVNNENSG